MPRPFRCRRVEQLPVYRSFSPDDIEAEENVKMTVDEFEALRLLDNEGLTQEACATRMNIARTTVTAIYDSARKKAAEALSLFHGAKRRFETKGRTAGVWIVDDYAHHPTEIEATLKAARQTNPKRLICAFQPHRYSRTQLLQKEFGGAFKDADLLILTDVYSAGEAPIALLFESQFGLRARELAADRVGTVRLSESPRQVEDARFSRSHRAAQGNAQNDEFSEAMFSCFHSRSIHTA